MGSALADGDGDADALALAPSAAALGSENGAALGLAALTATTGDGNVGCDGVS